MPILWPVCGKDADTWFHARLNVDHVIPVCHFTAVTGQPVQQADDDVNLVAACVACNNSKAQAKWPHS
jgi:5-methylcytosine-specific restriction endonuclease McrA